MADHKDGLSLTADILIACIENGIIKESASVEDVGDYFQTLYRKIKEAQSFAARSGD